MSIIFVCTNNLVAMKVTFSLLQIRVVLILETLLNVKTD